MGRNYTNITIQVPTEQADHWVQALQNIQENGVRFMDGYFVHPAHESVIDSSGSEWMNCEITKIRDQSKVFDPESIKEVLGVAGNVLGAGVKFVNALNGACAN